MRLAQLTGGEARLLPAPGVAQSREARLVLLGDPYVREASATVLAAGPEGVVLYEVIRGFQYAQTCAVLLMLIGVVSLIDLGSARLRRRFI